MRLRTLSLLALPLLATLLVSCEDFVTGPTTTVERDVAGFTRIDVSDGFTIRLVKGTDEGLTIEAPEGAMAHITSEVVDGTLRVDLENGISSSFSPKKLTIRARDIDGISLSGGCRLVGEGTFDEPVLDLELSGGSRVEMRVQASTTRLEASGGSVVTLRGTTDDLEIDDYSGGSIFSGFDLSTRRTTLEASGGSQLDVRASERLDVTASGGSIVSYKGRPAITADLSGGSRVIDEN